MSAFDDLRSIRPQLLAPGYLARGVHGEHLTLAVVEVEPGAELPAHQHANEQFGMVIEGSLILEVGAETRTVEPGGIWRIPGNTPHKGTGGEAAPSSLTSSPHRETTGPRSSSSTLGRPAGPRPRLGLGTIRP